MDLILNGLFTLFVALFSFVFGGYFTGLGYKRDMKEANDIIDVLRADLREFTHEKENSKNRKKTTFNKDGILRSY
ncbi:MAG: hypothetical protein GY938_18000 [Ketobacter sp.]|nr:hypothetical protein [Ketobacter sp.]